jgi:hypothetical protein
LVKRVNCGGKSYLKLKIYGGGTKEGNVREYLARAGICHGSAASHW